MKILFDDQTFNVQKFGGISRYFTELIARLPSFNAEALLNIKRSDNIHLLEKNLVAPNNNSFSFRGKERIKNFLGLQDKILLRDFIKKNQFDVFHPTYYATDFLKVIRDKPFVITVHDMIIERYFNKKFEMINWETICKETLLPKAAAIIAVSYQTKQDIIKFYPEIDPDKIKVIYHGNPFENIECHQIMSEYFDESKPYILYVGHRKFYKNFYWILDNLVSYIKDANIRIVCAGGGNFDDFEKRRLKILGIEQQVIYHEIKSDAHLFTLYSNALCFLYPSLYEGFGFPILEAFASGCPVILSKNGCFQEIAGDAASYFNLNDSLSLVESIDHTLNDSEFKNKLRQMGYEQLKNYTWKKCVEQHLKLYESIK